MADVDSKLAASLKQAKANPMFFVFVAKGNEGKLLVDKKKISAKDVAEVKKECGGGTIYKGRCKGEEGKMVFEVGKEVAHTLSALTKKIIKQNAGLTFEVEYRFAADLAAEENQAESAHEGANPVPAAVPPAPPAPPGHQPAPGGAEVTKRLNALSGGIKAALAGPNKARVQALFVSVNGLIKNKDFIAAGAALDELEPLVAKPTGAPAAASAGVPPAPSKAGESLPAKQAEQIPRGLVKYRTALLNYRAARATVITQLGNLHDAVADALPEEAEMAAELIERLDDTFTVLDDAIDDAINAAKNERDPYDKATRDLLRTFLGELRSDPLIKHVDNNPFVGVSVAATLGAALTNIENTMV